MIHITGTDAHIQRSILVGSSISKGLSQISLSTQSILYRDIMSKPQSDTQDFF